MFCFLFFVLTFLRSTNIEECTEYFFQEDNPSDNIVIVEEELHCIDIDDIGNLEDLECSSMNNKGSLK